MKFTIKRSTGDIVGLNSLEVKTLGKNGFVQKVQEIEVNTIEELLKIIEETETEIVLGKEEWMDKPYLEIYDDWRE